MCFTFCCKVDKKEHGSGILRNGGRLPKMGGGLNPSTNYVSMFHCLLPPEALSQTIQRPRLWYQF